MVNMADKCVVSGCRGKPHIRNALTGTCLCRKHATRANRVLYGFQ